MKKKIPVSFLFFLLPLFFFFFIQYAEEIDDVWFLLAHGRYVIHNGFPHTDFLSMHEGLHFVMQQWGFSTLLYFIYQHFGSIGVLFLTLFFNGLIVYFLYRICMIISSNNQYYSCLIASVIDLLLELNFILPRPQIISILLFVVALYLLERFHNIDKDKSIYYLPVISILLVNCHASMWLMLFIICLPYLVEYCFLRDKKEFILFSIMICSFVVGFLNPYGWEAMTYSLHSYGIPVFNQLIREMHAFSLKGDSFLVFSSSLIIVVIVTEIIFFIKNYKKYPIHYYFLFLGFSFMAILNLRNISFLLIGTIPFIIYGFSKREKVDISLLGIIIPIVIIIGIFCFKNYQGFYTLRDPIRENIVSYLDNHTSKNSKIFTYFNDGPYLEYYGYPVYIDTRAEVFLKKNNHKEDIFLEYYDVLIGKMDYDKFIQKYQFDYYVVHEGDLLYQYLIDNDYKVVYQDKDSNIFLIEKK